MVIDWNGPNKKIEEVIGRYSPTKKGKRLLVGTVPPKSEEVIGRNSPNKKFEKVISRNSPTKKLKRLLIGPVPKKIEEVIGKNSPTKNKFIGRNIATKK